jgi:hypothetical protein
MYGAAFTFRIASRHQVAQAPIVAGSRSIPSAKRRVTGYCWHGSERVGSATSSHRECAALATSSGAVVLGPLLCGGRRRNGV